MKVDIKEGHRLALRLKIHLKAHGVDIDTEKFYAMLEQGNSCQQNIGLIALIFYVLTIESSYL